jgi:hypothetical protein
MAWARVTGGVRLSKLRFWPLIARVKDIIS